jgi:hypothetical protein
MTRFGKFFQKAGFDIDTGLFSTPEAPESRPY